MGEGYIDPHYRYYKTYVVRNGLANSGDVHFRDTKHKKSYIRKPDGTIINKDGDVFVFNEHWELKRKKDNR